jgi:hypothetical protein
MNIYDKIWKIRCEEVVSFEKSQGIDKLDKRKGFLDRKNDKIEESGILKKLN